MHGEERGSVSLILLAVAALIALLAAAVADVGGMLSSRRAAVAAADAAALAAAPVTFRPFGAAGSARDEAARFAAANGARLVSCRCDHDPSWEPREVVVVVETLADLLLFGRRSVTARSRAEFVPTRLIDGS